MIDSKASNNFVSQREAERLGLCIIVEDAGVVQAANSQALLMLGRKVEILKIRYWEGWCKLNLVTINHFDMILGLKFMEMAKMMVAPHLKGILIGDEQTLYFVKVLPNGDKGKSVQEYGVGLSLGKTTFLTK